MKKITDERLILRNLKNIRITFVVQNTLMLLYLIYQKFNHLDSFSFDNPIAIILIIGGILNAILSINVSTPIADKAKLKPSLILLISLLSSLVVACFFYISFAWQHLSLAIMCGMVIGVVVGGCLLYANHFRA